MFPTAILLAHLKLSPSEIKQALLAMDTTTLSEQHLQQMETFAPDKIEVHIYPLLTKSRAVLQLHPVYNSVYCKSFTVEKFCGFHGSISNRETFPVK